MFPNDSEEAKRARIAKAKTDKFFFAKTYFPHYCEDDFAPMHRDMFKARDITNQPVIRYGFRESAKSSIMSLIDPCHKLLYKLRWFIEIVSASEGNATEFTMNIMAELDSNPRIINDFGDVKGQRWMFNDFYTKAGQRVLALGPRKRVKGKRVRQRRPDDIIVEDFEDRNSSSNPKIQKRLLKWLTTDLLKSVSSKMWSFTFICNYFSKKSMTHKLLTGEDYKHWNRGGYSAIIYDKNGKARSAWPERFPLKQLLAEKANTPSDFRVEMEQKPEDEDASFHEEWIKYYTEDELPKNLPTVTAVDPSAKSGEEHCFKAIIVLSVDTTNETYYVRHAWIKKTSKWRMIRAHFDLAERYDSLFDGIESVGFQETLKEDYEMEGNTRGKHMSVKMMPEHQNKPARISAMQTMFEKGRIKFIRNHSDQNLLIEQFLEFPDGDVDGPDALEKARSLARRYILKTKKQVKSRILGG